MKGSRSTVVRSAVAIAIAAALPALACAGGCGRIFSGAPKSDRAAEPHGRGGDEAGGDHEGDGDGRLHGEEKEASDLDSPIEQLFAQSCEHGKRTYLCDECRSEVGVARVPQDLVDDGLLRVEAARLMDLASPIELTGEVGVDETRTVHLSPIVPGIVRAVHVDLGSDVDEGQVLWEIDSLDLADASTELMQAKAEMSLVTKNLERQQDLLDAGVTSEREWLEAKQAWDAARIRVESARKKLGLLGSASGKKAKGYGRLAVTAPFAGTVLSLHAPVGELLEPGDSVMTLSDLSTLWVWTDVYEHDLARVADNLARGEIAASLLVQAYPEEEFPAVLDLLGAVMDETTRTVKARLSLPNPAGRVLPGMFGAVRLWIPGDGAVLALPASAILEDAGEKFVFVRHEGEWFVRRRVTTGATAGPWVQILGGMDPGAEVVTHGAFLLKSDVLRSKMGAGCAD